MGRLSEVARGRQIVASFVAVVVLYWLYWLIVVPLIEPTLDYQPTAAVSEAEVEEARHEVGALQQQVGRYFPPGSWELDRPQVWQSDQTRLLFKTLTPQSNGTVKLFPCTVLFFPKEQSPERGVPRPIIMQAPEGAEVRFDEPIVFKSVKINERKLEGGRLIGPIRIFRNPSAPGANDDLELTTREVTLVKDRATTPHPVDFRLGRNRGHGRELEITMAPADPAAGNNGRPGPIKLLELKRDVRMQLELGAARLAPAGATAAAANPDEAPVDITCQGSFTYDTERNAAAFHQQVNVFRPTSDGENDQLNGELLTAYFETKPAASPPPAEPPGAAPPPAGGTRVRLLEVRGDPVTVRSPSRGLFVHCRGLDYAPGEANLPGTLVALGPGWVQGHLPSDPSDKYDAKWTRQFRFEPVAEGQHRAAIIGEATVRYNQIGTITADEIFAFLTPLKQPAPPTAPPGAGRDTWQLERVLARVFEDKADKSRGSVVIVSPQLSGVTGLLEATVHRPVVDPAAPAAATPPGAEPPKPRTDRRAVQDSTRQFDVRGSQIHIGLVPDGNQLALSGVTIEGQARLTEIGPPKPGEKPLLASGDRLHVTDAAGETTRVSVSGRPGLLNAGGIDLRAGSSSHGGTIEMEKHTSRLWIEGPGQMTMPIEQDMDGRPLAQPQPLEIIWQGRMAFQGNSVVFERAVTAQSESRSLATEKLEAIFNRPIDFSNPSAAQAAKPEDRPQVTNMRCYGRALLNSRQLDERGERASIDDLSAVDLAIDRTTGAITAAGPGTVTRVSRGARARQAPVERPVLRAGWRDRRPRAPWRPIRRTDLPQRPVSDLHQRQLEHPRHSLRSADQSRLWPDRRLDAKAQSRRSRIVGAARAGARRSRARSARSRGAHAAGSRLVRAGGAGQHRGRGFTVHGPRRPIDVFGGKGRAGAAGRRFQPGRVFPGRPGQRLAPRAKGQRATLLVHLAARRRDQFSIVRHDRAQEPAEARRAGEEVAAGAVGATIQADAGPASTVGSPWAARCGWLQGQSGPAGFQRNDGLIDRNGLPLAVAR